MIYYINVEESDHMMSTFELLRTVIDFYKMIFFAAVEDFKMSVNVYDAKSNSTCLIVVAGILILLHLIFYAINSRRNKLIDFFIRFSFSDDHDIKLEKKYQDTIDCLEYESILCFYIGVVFVFVFIILAIGLLTWIV